MKQLVLVGRLVFGAWMLANGANYFFSLWTVPSGHEPLAIMLMTALVHSRLLDVAMVIQLVTGALILTGFFVPLALCVVMPISTCALYWSVALDHQLLGAVLALAAFALNGLLMLAYVDYYKDVLQRHALPLGESERSSFDSLFVNPGGRTSRGQFTAALITLLAVIVFYAFVVVFEFEVPAGLGCPFRNVYFQHEVGCGLDRTNLEVWAEFKESPFHTHAKLTY